MLYRMRQRRGTAAEWASINPVLGDGEIGVEKDTGVFKLGDGLRAWNSLPIALSSIFRQTSQAVDANTLDGRDSTEFALTTNFNSLTTSFNNLVTELDNRTLPASALRKLVSHWGTGTSFPTVGVLSGDTFIRSDVGTNGSLWTYVGGASGKSGWVHKGPIVCTSTTRPVTTGSTSIVYPGLQIYETDTSKTYIYNGTAYQWIPVGDSGFLAIAPNSPITFPATDTPWYRKVGVHVTVHINSNYNGSYGNGFSFASLPAAYRPPASRFFPCVTYTSTLVIVGINPTTGSIFFSGATVTLSGIQIDLEFDAA